MAQIQTSAMVSKADIKKGDWIGSATGSFRPKAVIRNTYYVVLNDGETSAI